MTRLKKIIFDKVLSRYGRRSLPLLAVLLLLVPNNTLAQTQKVDFGSTQITLKEAFRRIQSQTGLGIAYSSRVLDANRKVSIPVRKMSVTTAMDAMLFGTGFSYSLVSGVITIKKTPETVVTAPVAASDNGKENVETIQIQEQVTQVSAPVPDRRKAGPVIVVMNTLPESISPPQIDFKYGYYPIENYSINQSHLPRLAIKTNLLYAGAALTPNIALEYGTSHRTSVNISGSYNPWNRVGTHQNNKKLVHSVFKAEARYWTCDRFNGHYVGAHLLYSRYNISSHKIPTLFEKEYRYDGNGYGAGLKYGYHLMLAKRWGVEFSVGAGVVRMDYKRYDCAVCNTDYVKTGKTWFGPTEAGISLVFMIK